MPGGRRKPHAPTSMHPPGPAASPPRRRRSSKALWWRPLRPRPVSAGNRPRRAGRRGRPARSGSTTARAGPGPLRTHRGAAPATKMAPSGRGDRTAFAHAPRNSPKRGLCFAHALHTRGPGARWRRRGGRGGGGAAAVADAAVPGACSPWPHAQVSGATAWPRPAVQEEAAAGTGGGARAAAGRRRRPAAAILERGRYCRRAPAAAPPLCPRRACASRGPSPRRRNGLLSPQPPPRARRGTPRYEDAAPARQRRARSDGHASRQAARHRKYPPGRPPPRLGRAPGPLPARLQSCRRRRLLSALAGRPWPPAGPGPSRRGAPCRLRRRQGSPRRFPAASSRRHGAPVPSARGAPGALRCSAPGPPAGARNGDGCRWRRR